MKRILDLLGGLLGTVIGLPFIAIGTLCVLLEDHHFPLYASRRVGLGGRTFRMLKIRTMILDADATGVHTTAGDDPRLLRVGRVLRSLKIDELPQFWHVLSGQMSLVGPRPNVPREVEMYSDVERGLLSVRPGVTDFASLVFSDLSDVMSRSSDPNRDYNLLVRPWKSRLGLHYVRVRGVTIDLCLVLLTALKIVRPRLAGTLTVRLLERSGADPESVRIARRDAPLQPTPPPGVSRSEWVDAVTYRSSVDRG